MCSPTLDSVCYPWEMPEQGPTSILDFAGSHGHTVLKASERSPLQMGIATLTASLPRVNCYNPTKKKKKRVWVFYPFPQHHQHFFCDFNNMVLLLSTLFPLWI